MTFSALSQRLRYIRPLLGLFFLASMLSGCGSNPPSPGSTSQELLTASDETEESKRAQIRLELASGYFEKGQTTIALDELKQSLSIHPNNPEAFNLRGLIYMRLGEKSLAEESFRRAQSLAPRNASVLHNFGWFQCNQFKFREADELFRQALATPNYLNASKTYLAQAMCYQKNNQLAEAENAYSRSYELDSQNPIVGYNLALLQFSRKDDRRAQFYVKRINGSEYANAQTLWLGIKIERRLGNSQGVRELGDELMKKFGSSEEARKFERSMFED